MNPNEVKNAEQARQFLQTQETTQNHVIDHLPADLRRYASQYGITEQLTQNSNPVYFLQINGVQPNRLECSIHWFTTEQNQQKAQSAR